MSDCVIRPSRRGFLAGSAAVGAAMALARPGWAAAGGAYPQRALDALAIALYNSAPVRRARAEGRRMLAGSPNARHPGTGALIGQAVDEQAFSAAQAAANDPADPFLPWVMARAHAIGGLQVPGARYGTENPDNYYRFMPVLPGLAYRISGRLAATPATATSFTLLTSNNMDGITPRTVAALNSSTIRFEADGRFTLTIDGNEAGERPNHLRSTAEARGLLVRETMGDWERDLPGAYRVECLNPAAAGPRPDFAARARQAAELALGGLKMWALEFELNDYDRLPANSFGPIINSAKRVGGLVSQMSAHGLFELADDEALVVTVPDFGARYYGFELADLWMVSCEYVTRTGSLNTTQALPNPDGSRTIVVANRDPGYRNWANPAMRRGTITCRIQDFDAARVGEQRVSARLVKLADLAGVVPAGLARVTPGERRAQLVARAASYQRRVSALGYAGMVDVAPAGWPGIS